MKISNIQRITTGMIRIGFHCVEPIDTYSAHTIICAEKDGCILFRGTAHIGRGAIIHVHGGELNLGNNFAISGTTSIVCKNRIDIGNNVQLSYNGLIIDSDAHHIYSENGELLPNTSPISIGNKVWVAPNVTIQKGSQIPNNTVIASNSLVNRKFNESNLLIGGVPSKILKKISSWKI